MAKRVKKVWMQRPQRPAKPPFVSEKLKEIVEIKASDLIKSFLKPQFVKSPPEDLRFNYIVDIYAKWYRGYFYFCERYCSPGPYAITPFFDLNFARLTPSGIARFNLAFMRYTGHWVESYFDKTIDECLAIIKEDPWFQPD